jgi:ClpP class serine protease
MRQFRLSSPYAAIAYRTALDLVPRTPADPRTDGSVVVVPVVGPIEHRFSPYCSSYQGVLIAAEKALASKPSAVVLDLETPGGDVTGCFDSCAALRAMFDAAGVPLIAFVNLACSAGFALAAVCDSVVISATGSAGSVGVISHLEDHTERLEREGVKIRLVASGARKADGNPAQPLTDEAVAARQAGVDKMASAFFEHVSARRRLPIENVVAMQAAVYIGDQAVAAGLADSVETFSALVARLQKGETMDAKQMMDALKAKIAAGELSAADAMAALGIAAKAEGEEPPKEEPPKEEPAARASSEPPKEEPAAKALSNASFSALFSAPDFAAKAKLLETRPDFSAVQQFQLLAAPIEAVRFACLHIGRASAPVAAPAAPTAPVTAPAVEAFAALQASAQPAAIAASGGAGPADPFADLEREDPREAARLRAAFGLTRPTVNVTSFDAKQNIQYFGHTPKGATVISPASAK